jgi:cytochrome c biogenesis protein CcmG, thiol:disulfide interchange protein DsbE
MGAVICWVAAFLIVAQTGLPERVDYTGYLEAGQRVAPELNAIAPPFSLPTLAGNRLRLADLRGRVVIVNFWATWCEPCKVEMPELQALYQQYEQRGLRVLAVNLGESRGAVQQWADTFGLTFDVLQDEKQQVAAQYQLRGQPSTYIISPGGIIMHIVYGPVSREALEAAIAPFLTNG